MKVVQDIIKQLDDLPNNKARKEYLENERKRISKSDIRRFALNIMINDDFVEKYYRFELIENVYKFFKSLFNFKKQYIRYLRISVNIFFFRSLNLQNLYNGKFVN